jgi:hypothetical protein
MALEPQPELQLERRVQLALELLLDLHHRQSNLWQRA